MSNGTIISVLVVLVILLVILLIQRIRRHNARVKSERDFLRDLFGE